MTVGAQRVGEAAPQRLAAATPALAALFLAGLTLRPQVVGVAPLVDRIQADLSTSHAVVGLLGAMPVLGMGLLAPVAAYLAALIGIRRAMTIGLALIGAFGALRAFSPDPWTIVMLTLPLSIGMGLGNALAPLAVRETVPDQAGAATGVYTGGIQIGSMSAAALAVPLAAALGGWRPALLAFSLVACVLTLAWLRLGAGASGHVRPETLLPRLPLRSGRAWLLVAIFATLASAYYGLNAWLPDAYAERGWSPASSGALLAAMNATAIPASFVVPLLSDRFAGRRAWLIGLAIVFVIGGVGLAALPGGAYGWSLFAGLAQGGLFTLVMTLPLDLTSDRETLGGLVAMMLGLGYALAALAPFLFGAVRDGTGSFDAVLWLCVACLGALLVLVITMSRPHTTR